MRNLLALSAALPEQVRYGTASYFEVFDTLLQFFIVLVESLIVPLLSSSILLYVRQLHHTWVELCKVHSCWRLGNCALTLLFGAEWVTADATAVERLYGEIALHGLICGFDCLRKEDPRVIVFQRRSLFVVVRDGGRRSRAVKIYCLLLLLLIVLCKNWPYLLLSLSL